MNWRSLWLIAALFIGGACQRDRDEMTRRDESAETTGATLVRIGGIDWYSDYDQALARAKEVQKPLWLHFGENPG